MVSKASDDLPEPLNPVITTNLSRGMERLRFFKLCWRAPPILMNFPVMTQNFAMRPLVILHQTARKESRHRIWRGRNPLRCFTAREEGRPVAGDQRGGIYAAEEEP